MLLFIGHRQRIGTIIKYKAEENYLIEVDNYLLTIKSYNNKAPAVAELTQILNPKPAIIRIINPSLKIKLTNGITVYRNKKDVTTIKKVVKIYL